MFNCTCAHQLKEAVEHGLISADLDHVLISTGQKHAGDPGPRLESLGVKEKRSVVMNLWTVLEAGCIYMSALFGNNNRDCTWFFQNYY